jgi:hypothetical protein
MSNADIRKRPEITEAMAEKLNAIAASTELLIASMMLLERAANIVGPYVSQLQVPGGATAKTDIIFSVAAGAYNSVARPLEELGVIQRAKPEPAANLSPERREKVMAQGPGDGLVNTQAPKTGLIT